MRVRRKHQRFVRRLETEFIGDNKTYRAVSSNFSLSGLFIRTNHAFIPGTELDVVIHLPNKIECRVKGVVRRAIKTTIVSLNNGMGIEILVRDRNYNEFLKEFDPSVESEPVPPPPEKNVHPEPDFVIIACSQCGAKNKVRRERLSHGPKCGRCGTPISFQA